MSFRALERLLSKYIVMETYLLNYASNLNNPILFGHIKSVPFLSIHKDSLSINED